MFFASPTLNGVIRMQEHAADVYGLEVIHGIVPNSEEVAAHAFQILGEIDLADPNPPAFIRFWLYSHPPLAERLIFAHSYDPWSKGESTRNIKPRTRKRGDAFEFPAPPLTPPAAAQNPLPCVGSRKLPWNTTAGGGFARYHKKTTRNQ